MKLVRATLWCLLAAGCAGPASDVTDTTADRAPQETAAASVPLTKLVPASEVTGSQLSQPHVPLQAGVATLNEQNTLVQFVGTHTGDEPNPRTGVFTRLEGTAEVDRDTNTLRAISVLIHTDSLTTAMDKLTTHLKSPDFFDTREYATARFETASIEPVEGPGGQAIVTGNLTLLDATRKIEFPATVSITDQGLALDGQFTIDRAEFGMDFGLDRVNKEVQMTVNIGKPSKLAQPEGDG
jgi:polyisoprenoid-binding protein YceI